jgi:hypothetical protein
VGGLTLGPITLVEGLGRGIRSTIAAFASANYHVELLLELLLIGTTISVLNVLVQMAFTVTTVMHFSEALFTNDSVSTSHAEPCGNSV